jgi:DNA-binding FadR family transcriptional regulator
MTILRLPQNRPLYEQVCELIESRIIEGDLRVGDKLPTENEMAELYQVSRTVIREAMKALKEKGWIETRVAKGTFVVDNVAKKVRASFDAVVRMDPGHGFSHLIEVREILEPEVAALVASRADPAQTARIRQAVDQMDRALENQDDIEAFLNADFTFHMLLAESTGNPLIPIIISPVVKLMRDLQTYYLSRVEGGMQRSQVNHQMIMQAIENRDAAAARQYMKEHIHQVRTDVEEYGSAGPINDIFNHIPEEIPG